MAITTPIEIGSEAERYWRPKGDGKKDGWRVPSHSYLVTADAISATTPFCIIFSRAILRISATDKSVIDSLIDFLSLYLNFNFDSFFITFNKVEIF